MTEKPVDASATQAVGGPPDYDQVPVVIFWEVTRACAMVCRHCRAEAQPKRHPLELTTREGFALLDQMADFGNRPIVVITGGDALMRRDVFDFVGYGLERGLIVSLAPSATALVRPETLRRLKEAGLSRISFSLDGARPETHDSFRGVKGSFQRTHECIADAVQAGLSLQVNTAITRHSVPELDALAGLVEVSGAVLWDIFTLVPTGRALREDMISAQEHERVYHWIYDLSQRAPFAVRATLGQPYRRVIIQRQEAAGGKGIGPARGYQGAATNEGKGVCFVSHTGEVQPSGFLPLSAGNVRTRPLADIYRTAPLFRRLRDPGLLKGKCGICPFKVVCGGCRARAYAVTGDYLEEEPSCVFQPEGESTTPSVVATS